MPNNYAGTYLCEDIFFFFHYKYSEKSSQEVIDHQKLLAIFFVLMTFRITFETQTLYRKNVFSG